MSTIHLRCKKPIAPSRRNIRCNGKLAYSGTKNYKEVKCPRCNKAGMVNITKEVVKYRKKEGLCKCDGLFFSMKNSPHRKGSKWCQYYTGVYDEEDYKDYYSRRT